MEHLVVAGVSVDVDPLGGLLDNVVFEHGGRRVAPLHRAPWLGVAAEIPPDTDPHLAKLAGDFFCAPFCKPDVEPSPFHGWSSNGEWRVERRHAAADGALTVDFRLVPPVMGAVLRKHVTVRPGQPVVYQRHVFHGGAGALPVAHHAMVHVPGGAALSFSPKDFGATPVTPAEPDPARGRSLLAYPQRFASLSAVALAAGGTVDASHYPYAHAHEEFCSLFDPQAATLGWSAALAVRDGFLFFALKDARVLTSTSLWMSNGGRDFAPWLSRHFAVLGIEESCAHFGEGHLAAITPNALTAAGYRTALTLDPAGETVVRYAFGGIPADPSWTRVTDIRLQGDTLTITDAGGASATLPFDPNFFADA
jgi:hypothetical protein